MRRPGLSLAAALAAFALAGCETLGYYGQAIGGHLDVMARARPVEAWLADPATPGRLRERLTAAQAIRDFAVRELALPDNASYRSYADLGRRYVLWNVVATPEFSLAPVQSCFPVAGCVAYRGFYDEARARAHAGALAARGHDVRVAGVAAYSTLGWLDDPLLSTFIDWPEAELARLVFHELAHQVVYVRDDSTFNESFAVAVEMEGLRRWLAARGDAGELERARLARERAAGFAALMGETRARLAALYRESIEAQAMRERKREELAAFGERYAALRAAWGGFAGYDRIVAEPNNALFASFATYNDLVPAFERLLAESGGDLVRFYARVRELAALPRAGRLSVLSSRDPW